MKIKLYSNTKKDAFIAGMLIASAAYQIIFKYYFIVAFPIIWLVLGFFTGNLILKIEK